MSFEQQMTRRRVILAKVETTAGTAETPSASTDAMMALTGSAVTPQGEVVSDDRLSDYLSKQVHSIGKLVSGYTGRHELRGGGIDGSAVDKPDVDALLQACGLVPTQVEFVETGAATGTFSAGETVTGGTSSATGLVVAFVDKGDVRGLILEAVSGTFVDEETLTGGTSSATATAAAGPVTGWQYLPTSTPESMKTATIVYHSDRHKHVISGCRGDVSVDVPVGQPAILSFTMNGRWADPVAASRPTPTLNTAKPPLCVNMGLAVGDYDPEGVTAVALGLGNALEKDESVNATDGLHTYIIADRDPSGSLDPKADSLDNFNPFTIWKNGTTALLDMLVGSSAGNRVYILCPVIQYTDAPTYGDRNGVQTYALNFQPKIGDGDDEIRLVYF